MLDFYQKLAQALPQTPVVLATVVSIKGSVPREIGAKMFIYPNREITGTIGGGAGEAKVIQTAIDILATGQKQLIKIDLSGVDHRETQGVCGGIMQIWIERWTSAHLTLVNQIIHLLSSGQSAILITPFAPESQPYLEIPTNHFENHPSSSFILEHSFFQENLIPQPTLLIIGAGHVAIPLAQIAYLAGFQIIVQDDRPEFATKERFPQASAILPFPITNNYPFPMENLYVALVTRGIQQDLAALRILLKQKTKYIGAIGSLKRVHLVKQQLAEEGYRESGLKSIYAPIGLDIGALTPEEIAVSICAELIKVRRGGTGKSLTLVPGLVSSEDFSPHY